MHHGGQAMNYPDDIYTEPSDVDIHTLRNLGPLTALAGIWEGQRSLDVNPKAAGPMEQEFVRSLANLIASLSRVVIQWLKSRVQKFQAPAQAVDCSSGK